MLPNSSCSDSSLQCPTTIATLTKRWFYLIFKPQHFVLQTHGNANCQCINLGTQSLCDSLIGTCTAHRLKWFLHLQSSCRVSHQSCTLDHIINQIGHLYEPNTLPNYVKYYLLCQYAVCIVSVKIYQLDPIRGYVAHRILIFHLLFFWIIWIYLLAVFYNCVLNDKLFQFLKKNHLAPQIDIYLYMVVNSFNYAMHNSSLLFFFKLNDRQRHSY